ncbi:MAG: lysylphosphatidylglycerol synthase transmembrane domain-containing protein [Bacteroidetes bacterium]|nr:lysylphosphatidylglycerol synthase transmembrane domain-containing protein [Bacteroidota bacterium]
MQKTSIRIWVPIVLSLAVLIAIALFTVEPDTLPLLGQTRWGLLALAPFVVGLRVMLGAWRLHYIAKGLLRFSGALRAQLAWDFFSCITPSSIGGGPITPAYIARDSQVSLGDSSAIMLFAILLDQIWFACTIVLILLSTASIDVIPDSLGNIGVLTLTTYFLGYLAWIIIFAYGALKKPEVLSWVVQRVFMLPGLRRFSSKADSILQDLQERANVLRSQRPIFFLNGFGLTLLAWASRYALVVLIVAAIAPEVDYILSGLRSVVTMLGMLAVPTPGGAGGAEGLFALLVGPLLPQALVSPTALIWRMLGYYVFLAAGAYLTLDGALRNRN